LASAKNCIPQNLKCDIKLFITLICIKLLFICWI